jgi:hypothetical protein
MNQIQVQEARRAKVREQQSQPRSASVKERVGLTLVSVVMFLQRLMTA